jgi:hypothetical protein
MIYIFISKAAPCTPKRAFQQSPQDKIDGRTSTHTSHSIPSDYIFSCPCNREPPRTHTPLQTRIILRQTIQYHTSCHRRWINWLRFFPPGTTFVQMSSRLSTEGTYMANDYVFSHCSRPAYRLVTNRV